MSAVAFILWPQATGYVSKFAVINAPVLTVRAPMNGVITVPTPGLGAAVRRDQVLLDIQTRASSDTERIRASSLAMAKARQADALQDEENNLRRILRALEARSQQELSSEIAFLTFKLDELRAIRRRTEAQWDETHHDLARISALSSRGLVPTSDLDNLEFELRELDAQLSADDARIEAIEVELDAIKRNLPSPAGTGRRDFAYDRMDDMSLALVDIQTRRRTVEAERDAAKAVSHALETERSVTSQFQPLASSDGVIWTASRQSGASVTDGSDLFQVLDCERRFVEVVFDEKAFEDIPAGTEASVLLRGASTAFGAMVVSRHAGGGGTAVSAVDAAIANPLNVNGVTVFLRLDPADITNPAVAAAFCDVGRTAEVQIRDPRFVGLFDPVHSVWAAFRNRWTTQMTARN